MLVAALPGSLTRRPWLISFLYLLMAVPGRDLLLLSAA